MGLDLPSALVGASLVVAIAAWVDDDRRRRFFAVGIAGIAAVVAAVSGAPWPVVVAAVLALVASGLATTRWLRDQRPVRLDAEQLRLQKLVFSDMTAAQVARLLDAGHWRDVEPGVALQRPGKAPKEVMLMVSGQASVQLGGEATGVVKPGQFVGSVGWITGQPTDFKVLVSRPTRVMLWTRKDLDALFSRWPEMRTLFNVAVARDLAGKLSL